MQELRAAALGGSYQGRRKAIFLLFLFFFFFFKHASLPDELT